MIFQQQGLQKWIIVDQPSHLHDGVAEVAITFGEFEHKFLIDVGLRSCGIGIERLAAPHTGWLVVRRLPFTTGADDGRDIDILIVRDFQPVQFGISLLIIVGTEPGQISGRGFATPFSTMPVFDAALLHTHRDEPTHVRLPEVRRRHRLFDIRPVGNVFKDLQVPAVADSVGFKERRPEMVIFVARELTQPLSDVRDTRNKRDFTLARLAVDDDTQAVLAVGERVSSEVVELAATQPGVELERDECFISRVFTLIKHRLDVSIPFQHVRALGDRIIITGGFGRDPTNTVREIVAVGHAARERAEDRSIVPVGLFIVVGGVDPADDCLGSVPVFKGVGKAATMFSHPSTLGQQLSMSVVAVLFAQQIELLGKFNKQVGVAFVRYVTFAGFNPLAERFNLSANVFLHTDSKEGTLDCEGLAQSQGRDAGQSIGSQQINRGAAL